MLFLKFTFSVFSVKLWNQTNPICLDKGDFNKVLETELFEITLKVITHIIIQLKLISSK